MARIRTIKPEFWKHEELSALPESVHMLAAALLNYADDEGYFNANEKLVKAECSPLRESSVSTHDALTMLSNAGYLRLGKGSDGKRYGWIVNFDLHQRVNRKTPSKIKKLNLVYDDSLNTHTQLTEDSPQERKGKEGKEDGPSAPSENVSRGTSEEAELYERGKQVLGKNAGGLIAKLLKSKNGSVPLARAAIEQASTKQSPSEYIGRIVRGPAATGSDFYNTQAGIL